MDAKRVNCCKERFTRCLIGSLRHPGHHKQACKKEGVSLKGWLWNLILAKKKTLDLGKKCDSCLESHISLSLFVCLFVSLLDLII